MIVLYAPASDLATALASRSAETTGLALAAALRPFELVLWPLAVPLARANELLTDKLPEPKRASAELKSAEMEYLVDEVERLGGVGADPAEIIRNVLEFGDRRVADVMVSRTRIDALDAATPIEVVRRLVADSGHSRYPVYEGQIDNVVGLLCAKDVFKLEADDGARVALMDVVRRELIFAPENQKLTNLLREMRQKRQHLAVVVDEFGGTSGIVTLEDIIEEIVGDIRDEHDEAAELPPIEDGGGDRLLATATLSLGDLGTYLGLDVPEDDRGRSLAALFAIEGASSQGAALDWNGVAMVATEIEAGHVVRVEITRPARSTQAPQFDA
jgi:CBS domain containing-hemolysin-like protein